MAFRGKKSSSHNFSQFFCCFGRHLFPTRCASKCHYRFDFYTSPVEFNRKADEGYSAVAYVISLLVVFSHPFSFYYYCLDHQKAHVGSIVVSIPSLSLLSLQANTQSHEIFMSWMDDFSTGSSSIEAVIMVVILHEYLNGTA